jgi:hypothetical protein
MQFSVRPVAWATALSIAFTHPAGADSGRFCGDPVESGQSKGQTQEEALAAAQKWWSSRAGALGRGYQN